MAFFGVTRENIATVRNHPNADKLDICTLDGMSFQFVTGRGQYSVGDSVLYFPIDSSLPFELMEKLNLVREKKIDGRVIVDDNGKPVMQGCLSGWDKSRLKTIVIRGEISQGLVGPISLIDGMSYHDQWNSEEITKFLGVTKYEPPEDMAKPEWLKPLPAELSVYDIENADRYTEHLCMLMSSFVCITEKVEGTNFSATYRPNTGEFFINQRKDSIIPEGEGKYHPFWKWANNNNLKEIMVNVWPDKHNCMTLYGEFIGPGIQGNIYNLKENTVLFYDISLGHSTFLPVVFKMKIFEALVNNNINIVPILHNNVLLKDVLDGKTIAEFSNGESRLCKNVRREGVVITPMEEKWDDKIGRLILKQHSPEYLIKSRL